jgi:SOS-response transcriptional repressor LexA
MPETVELEGARSRLLKLAHDKRFSLRELSRLIDRNPSYLHQWAYKGSPKVLPEKERLRLASVLSVDERILRDEGFEGEAAEASATEVPAPRARTGEFFTPRHVVEAMARAMIPILSRQDSSGRMARVDPAVATGGFIESAILAGEKGYALRIEDPTLAPKFEPGDLAIVDPDRLAVPGDYVALTMADHTIEIGRLVERTREVVEIRKPSAVELARFQAPGVVAVDKIVAVAFR